MKELTLDDLRNVMQGAPRLRKFKACWEGREYDLELYEHRHNIVLVTSDKLLQMIQDECRYRRWAEVGLKPARSPGIKGVTPWHRWSKNGGTRLSSLESLMIALDNPRTNDGSLRLYEPSGNGRLIPVSQMWLCRSKLLFDIDDTFKDRVAKAAENHIRNVLG